MFILFYSIKICIYFIVFIYFICVFIVSWFVCSYFYIIIYKKMRIDSLIIFSVRRNSYVSNLRGKQPKYFLKNNTILQIWSANVNYRCVVIIGFQKSRSPLSNLFRGGEKNYNYYNYNRVPGAAGGSKKSGSSNQRRHTQGREKRRPSTLMLWEKTHAPGGVQNVEMNDSRREHLSRAQLATQTPLRSALHRPLSDKKWINKWINKWMDE